MTRDSASGTGPETDPENEVTESSEAAGKTSAETAAVPAATERTDETTPVAAGATSVPATPAPAGKSEPVAVDTTDDEPGDVSDTTDEGAVVAPTTPSPVNASSDTAKVEDEKPTPTSAPDLTLRPLPTPPGGQKITSGSGPAEDPTPPDTSLTTATVSSAAVAEESSSAPYGGEQETLGNGPVPPAAGATQKHATLVPLIGTLVALAALAALLIGAMALPIAKSKPDSVPVAVAGTSEITSQLTTLMEQLGGKGTFDVHVYTTQNQLKKAIEDRKVYGGLFVDNTQAQMMVASAAGIQVSDALQTVANTLQQQAQATVSVTDVVAQPSQDPRGDGLSAAQLPLAVVAVLPAIFLTLLYRRRPLAQIGGAVLASAAVGLAIAAVLNYGSGSTHGSNFWLLAAGLAAGVLATTIILLGLNALAGRIGLGIGVAVLVLLGAPLSGLSAVPEWLPSPWGDLGQLLPTGATATALRSMAFFDGHGSKSALLVMLMWLALGLLLLGLGTLLHRSNQRLADLKAEEDAARLGAEDDERTPVTV